jgi:hypothetical protein
METRTSTRLRSALAFPPRIERLFPAVAVRWLALAACAGGMLGVALPAQAERPQPIRALRAAVDLPLALLGDAAASTGLLGAAGIALAGDALSALDANRVSEPVLAGRLSAAVHQLAWSLSHLGTGSFEALRGIDIERWPEPAAAYRIAAPGAGRLDTALDGVAALALVPCDIASGMALVALHGAGAEALAARLEAAQRERRDSYVGPAPAPAAAPRGAVE